MLATAPRSPLPETTLSRALLLSGTATVRESEGMGVLQAELSPHLSFSKNQAFPWFPGEPEPEGGGAQSSSPAASPLPEPLTPPSLPEMTGLCLRERLELTNWVTA